MISKRLFLASAAAVLALASVALGERGVHRPAPANLASLPAPAELEPFALARLLAEGSPDVVVVALDGARHPLRGAQPIAVYGAGDDAFVANAPRARRVVLAGLDVVREDRLARRLAASGHDARVLAGGLDAWDRAMDADPAPPAAGATDNVWRTYRTRVALRHAFGDAAPAAVAPVAAPIAPAAGPAGGAPKKREGC